jgi:pseudouridine kinase
MIILAGGCHRDVVARPSGAFEPATSCPGTVRDTPGGVARNVAVLVASAGVEVALMSRVGDDAAGRSILAGLSGAGIDTGLTAVDTEVPTGCYVAIHDEAGELVAAVSDLGIYDRMTPESLVTAMEAIRVAPLVFADANLPAASLTAIALTAGPRLAVDAISRAKALRILPALGHGALGFLNFPAASALLGADPQTPAEAAEGLAAAGIARAVVTGGARPVAVLDAGRITVLPVPAVPVTDVTGAGDALIAGTLVALSRGVELASAVGFGIEAAGAALACAGALDRLPATMIQKLPPSPAKPGATP